MTQRRTFLRNLTLASAVVAFKPAMSAAVFQDAAVSKAPKAKIGVGGPLGREDFAVHVGTGFTTDTGEVLVLTETATRGYGKKVDSFRLKFRGGAATALEEKIHRFSHPQLGTFEIFIQPRAIVGNESECGYSADFTRLI